MESVQCPRCNGTGDIPTPSGVGVMKCFVCGGHGTIDEKDLEWKSKWGTPKETSPAKAEKRSAGVKKASSTTKTASTARTTRVAAAPAKVVVEDTGRTPLHREASDGFLRGVRELLESGADVNARDNDGRTPLHWPAYRGHLEVVRLLCEHGADVNAADNAGRTPLKLATIGNKREVIALLEEHGAEA